MVVAKSETATQRQAAARERRVQRAQVRKALEVREARREPAKGIEYALRAERDGRRIHNAPFHLEWQQHFTENQYAILFAPIEHGKSQQTIGRTLWELGKDPNLRVALISNTATQATKNLRQIRTEIERNPRWRELSPNLHRSRRHEDPWHATQITVERKAISKDPTIQVCGVYGDIIGSRLDLIVLDDVLDFENTRTEEQRKKLLEWFETTVFTRLVEGGRIWMIGTPWHPDDLMHVLSQRPGFRTKRYSAVHNPSDAPRDWRPIWPEQWSIARLLDRRANHTESTFGRKYLCRVRLDSTSRFREVWIDRMKLLGRGRSFVAEAPRVHRHGPALPCFTGVDLGVGQKEENALTVLFTIALMPNTKRLVCEIESGRWQAPEIVDRLESAYQRFDSTILVESNAAQKFIVDFCEGRVPVTPFHTGKNKSSEEYGVESLAVEMRNGLWMLPSGIDGKLHPEADAWIRECLYFDPQAHTGDRLMASWLAREALRRFRRPRARPMDTLLR